MGKSKTAALLIAVAIMGLGIMRTATASHNADHKAFSGGAEFKGLVVKTDAGIQDITSVHPDWTTVDSRGFSIPAGESQLVVVDFFVETSCLGSGGHCSARVLVGRTLGTAIELEPASGLDLVLDTIGDSSEGHAMSKALCVHNATGSPLSISVWLEATKLTADVSDFDIEDWTLKIAHNAPCSPSVDI